MLHCVVFLIFCLLDTEAKMLQSPAVLKASTGTNVSLTCTIVSGAATCYNVVWYIQLQTKAIQLLTKNERVSLAHRNTEKKCTLTINRVRINDTGTYFCSGCNIVFSDFGNGTKLIITDEPANSPVMFVLPPSAHEIYVKKTVTLICLVFNISAEDFNVFWNISGIIMSGLMHPSIRISESEKSICNQLTIAPDLWKNIVTYTCVVEDISGVIISKSIWKESTAKGNDRSQFTAFCSRVIALLLFMMTILMICFQSHCDKGQRKKMCCCKNKVTSERI
ncbi:immunoglobulin kappa light chain-like isoform X2 [Protopterus annectens]|uniref:immunoglobulin kappa light chain-like isoform X2 n=1 Tax=Protopterus annectens TaxID=7888 RepID=UPI001CFAE844|nr:immunoglobulin kappa light chain-like isoform X2 [Protopterus annectens]